MKFSFLKQTFAEVLINVESKASSWPFFRASVCILVRKPKFGLVLGWANTRFANCVGLENGATLISTYDSVTAE
tara:strand:- start:59 stop:280 length:222 start_codon:yes stop_codon:yes gene_type:complete